MGIFYVDVGVELSVFVCGVMVWSVLCELGCEGVVVCVCVDDDFVCWFVDYVCVYFWFELFLEFVMFICCLRYVLWGVGYDVDVFNVVIL